MASLLNAEIETQLCTYLRDIGHDMWVHACVCVSVCVCVRAYVYVYVYIYMHTYIHTYIYAYIQTYIHTHDSRYDLDLDTPVSVAHCAWCCMSCSSGYTILLTNTEDAKCTCPNPKP